MLEDDEMHDGEKWFIFHVCVWTRVAGRVCSGFAIRDY